MKNHELIAEHMKTLWAAGRRAAGGKEEKNEKGI